QQRVGCVSVYSTEDVRCQSGIGGSRCVPQWLFWYRFGTEIKKAEPHRLRLLTSKGRMSAYACFVYQSALMGVKFCHFSGRSSRAKIAVTGQTGTQAPQSIHSTGLMYSWGSDSNLGSSLRGWMQSTGQ